MKAGRYIGRVGALAAALGIGAAVLVGAGTAWAEDGADSGSMTSPPSSSSPQTSGGGSENGSETIAGLGRSSGADVDGGSGAGSGLGVVGDAIAAGTPETGESAKRTSETGAAAVAASPRGQRLAGLRKRDRLFKLIETRRTALNESGSEKGKTSVVTTTDTVEAETPMTAQDPPTLETPENAVAAMSVESSAASLGEIPGVPTLSGFLETVGQNLSTLLVAPTNLTAPLLGADRLAGSSDRLPYAPSVGITNGVITGTNSAASTNLSYNVLGKTANGGKINLDKTTGSFTFLPYREAAAGSPLQDDSFRVLIAQKTAIVEFAESIPVVKYFVSPVLVVLHQIPILNVVFAPIIGASRIERVYIDTTGLVAQNLNSQLEPNPIAFTSTVISFDGTPISVNYFPALGLEHGEEAPTILNGPSLATAGYTDPTQEVTVFGLVPGLQTLRDGYNVVTWDPRGEFASGGRLHLDSEKFEAKDVSKIIDWVSFEPTTKNEEDPANGKPGDPLMGMVGGSYGGGIQLTTAGIDKRVDAIAPGIAWNTLNEALYPNQAFKTSWASLLLLSLVVSGSRLDPQIYSGIATGVLFGFLTRGQQDFLSRNSPDTVVGDITVPTLFLQGTVDTLFPLGQAVANAEAIAGQKDAPPVKMIWYCGGHGQCLTMTQDQQDAQSKYLMAQTMSWMDTYVTNKGQPADGPDFPTFTWVDQKGNWYTSDRLPFETGFHADPITASGDGGTLPIVPILFGSGPQNLAQFPVSLTAGAKSRHAINVDIPVTTTGDKPTHVVGAPELTFTYSGLGTSRNVYAQLVDNETGLVIGNIVSPIPVTLDGRTHNTGPIAMENIVYTGTPGNKGLTLQIVDSASSFEDFTAFGVIKVSDVTVSLPTTTDATPLTTSPPVAAAV